MTPSTTLQTETVITFQEMLLKPEIKQVISRLGFTAPTEIQAKTIPLLLSREKIDFHGQAQTGTGKTLAFGLPLMHRIERDQRHVQALIVAPTRELALQIRDSLRPFTEALGISLEAIYGGASIEGQMRSLHRGVHIVVGTPGRLNDLLRRKALSLGKLKTLVLDEADIMLDMGFKEEVDEILEYIPSDREIWLFSATVKGGIQQIMSTHMRNPESVRLSRKQIAATNTKHYYCIAPMRARVVALCRFIENAPHFYGFVFCPTKILTSEVAEQLLLRGYRVGALHGDMHQAQRNSIIQRFKAKDIRIVVATDVAARGIDIAHLTHVINFSLPEDQESYVHRTGRTGRAGREGIAITFVGKGDLRDVQSIKHKFNIVIDPIDVPDRASMISARMQEVTNYIKSITGRTAPEEETLNTAVEALSEDDRKNALKQILFDKFLKTIYEEEEFSRTPALDQASTTDSHMQELFLTVGSEDGVRSEDIFAILDSCKINRDSIFKVRVIQRRTFLQVANDAVGRVSDALNQASLNGRRLRALRVRNSEQDQQGQGRYQGQRGGERRGGGGYRKPFNRRRR